MTAHRIRSLFRLCISILTFQVIGCAPTLSKTPIELPVEVAHYEPPHPQEFSLSNGMKVLFLQDSEIPIVRGAIYFSPGGLNRGELLPGSVGAMGALLRDGGVESLTADALDLELEKLSAGIDSSFGEEYGNVTFSCLAPDFDKVMDLTREVIRAPRFEEARFSLWKGQVLESIRRRKDSPDSISSIGISKLLYGDSILGRVLTSEDVKKISREDILLAYEKFVAPEGALIAVAGDISREKLESELERRFGDWNPTVRTIPDIPQISYKPAPGIYFLNAPFEQATIMIGLQGPKRLSKDYIPIEAFNQLLGSDGSFSSALVKSIRTEKGYAYSVVGGIYPGTPIGRSIIALQTKAQSAGESIGEVQRIVTEFQAGSIRVENLQDAVRASENSFIFRYESPDGIVQRGALLRLLNFPETYDDTFIPKLQKVTIEDVAEVAKRYWNLEDSVVLVVGNEKALSSVNEWIKGKDGPLSRLPIYRASFDEVLSFYDAGSHDAAAVQ